MSLRTLCIAAAVILCACSSERAPLVADDVVVHRPRPGMQMTAGYFRLRNDTKETITINRVSSPQFEAVEMHESILDRGVSRMQRLGNVTLAAGGTETFEPGGKHLMLMRPIGGFETVTLKFYSGESVVLTISVALTD